MQEGWEGKREGVKPRKSKLDECSRFQLFEGEAIVPTELRHKWRSKDDQRPLEGTHDLHQLFDRVGLLKKFADWLKER
jgi:hypothetical protein